MIHHTKRCPVCGLAETFPGVRLYPDGCNFCRERKKLLLAHTPSKTFCYTPPLSADKRSLLRKEMEHYFSSLRGERGIHGILAYSGGIDSTYVLQLLTTTYKLNIVPVTVDMGYLNKNALRNIKHTVKKLRIKKHLIITAHTDLFLKTNDYFLRRVELLPIQGYNPRCCMVCHHMIDLILYRAARELGASFIASGLDRFQTPPELNFLLHGNGFYSVPDAERHFETLTKFWPKELFTRVLTKKDQVFLKKCISAEKKEIKIISPTWLLDYDKAKVAKQLLKQQIIKNTDNTNCSFIPVANLLHEMKYGYGINEFTASSKVWERKMKDAF